MTSQQGQAQPKDGSWLGWATTTVIGGLSRFYSSGSKRRSDSDPAVSPRSQRRNKQRRVPNSTDQTFDAERSGDAFHPQSAFRHRRNNTMHVTIDESMDYRDADGGGAGNGTQQRRAHPATPHPSMFMDESEFNTSMTDDVGNMTDGEVGLTPAAPSGSTSSTPSTTPAEASFDALDSLFVSPTPTPAMNSETPTAVITIDADDVETASASPLKKPSADTEPTPKQDKEEAKVVPKAAAEPKQKPTTPESWPTPASVPIGVPADTLDNVDITGMNNEDIRKLFDAATLDSASSRFASLSFTRRAPSEEPSPLAKRRRARAGQRKSSQKSSKKSPPVDTDEFSESDDQSADPDFDEIDESIKKAAAVLPRPKGHVPSDGTRNKADRRPITPARGKLKRPSNKRPVKSPLTGRKRTKRDENSQFEGESPGRQGKTPKRAKKNDVAAAEEESDAKHADANAMDMNVSTEDKAAIEAAIASDSEDNVMDDVAAEESKASSSGRSNALVVVASKSKSRAVSKRHARKKGKHSDGNWWKDKRGMYCKYDPGHPNFIRVSETDWRVIQYEAMDPNVRLPIDSLKSLNESLNGGSPLPASYFRTPKSLFDLESDVESVFDSERDQSDDADSDRVSFDRDALQRVGDTRITVIDDDERDEVRRSRSKRSSRPSSSLRRSAAAAARFAGRRHRSATRSSSKRRRNAYEPAAESGSEDEFDEYLRWKSRVRRGKRRRLESDKALLPAIAAGGSIDSPQNLAAMAEALRGSGLYAVEMKGDDVKKPEASASSSSSAWTPDTKPPSLTDINKAKLESEQKAAADAAPKASSGSSLLPSSSSSSSSTSLVSLGAPKAASASTGGSGSGGSGSFFGGLGGSGASALGSLSKPSAPSIGASASALGSSAFGSGIALGGSKSPAAKKKRSRSPSAPESKEEDEKASSGLWGAGLLKSTSNSLSLSAKKPADTSSAAAAPAKPTTSLFDFSTKKHVPGGASGIGSAEKPAVADAKAGGDADHDSDGSEGQFAPGADDSDSDDDDSDAGVSTPGLALNFDSKSVAAFGAPKNTFAPSGFAPSAAKLPSDSFSFSSSSNKKDKDDKAGEDAGGDKAAKGGLFSGTTSGGFGGFGSGSAGPSLFSTKPLATSATAGAASSPSLFGNASGSGGSSWDTPSFSTKPAFANDSSSGSKSSSSDESKKKRKTVDLVDFMKDKPKPNFGSSTAASASSTKTSLADLLNDPKMTKGYGMPKSLSARAGKSEGEEKKADEDTVDQSQQDFLKRIKPTTDLFANKDYSIDSILKSSTEPPLAPLPSTAGASTASSAPASSSTSVPSSTSAASISVPSSSTTSGGKLPLFSFAGTTAAAAAETKSASTPSPFGAGFGSSASQPPKKDESAAAAADTATRKVQGSAGTGGLKISFSNTSSSSSKPKFPGAETPRDTSNGSGAAPATGLILGGAGVAASSSSSSNGNKSAPSFGSSMFGSAPTSVKINGGSASASVPFSFASSASASSSSSSQAASTGGSLFGASAAASSSSSSSSVGGFSFNGLTATSSTAQQKSTPFTEVPNTDSNGMKTDDSMASGGISAANGAASSAAPLSTSLFGSNASSAQSFGGTFGQPGKGPLGSGVSGLGSGFGVSNGAASSGGSLFGNTNNGIGGGLQGASSSSKPPAMFGGLSNLIDTNSKAQIPQSMLAQPVFKPSNKPLFAPNDPKTQVPSTSTPFASSTFGSQPFTMNATPNALPTVGAGVSPFSMGGAGMFGAPNPAAPGGAAAGGIGGASPFSMGAGMPSAAPSAAGAGAAAMGGGGGFSVGTTNTRKIYRGRRRATRR